MEEDDPNNLITVIGDENITDPELLIEEEAPQTKNGEEEEEEEVRQKEDVKIQEEPQLIIAQQRGEMSEASQAVARQSTEVATESVAITFFVVGRTGGGKSSLINSLVGKGVAKVSKGPEPVRHKAVEPHKGQVGNEKIKALLYDTRGLGTPDDIMLVKRFKEEMVKGGNQFFILICQKLPDRLDDSVRHFAKLLARELKDDYSIWLRCIIVLTQANKYFNEDEDTFDDEDKYDDDDSEEKRKSEMTMVIATWSEKFKECLQEFEVPKNIIMNMPVCVAGNRKTLALPVTEDWIETLLETCRSTGKEFQDVTGIAKRSRNIGKAVGDIIDNTFKIENKFGSIGGYIGWKIGLHASNKMIYQRLEDKLKRKGMLQND